MPETLTVTEARRLAIAAQGFAARRRRATRADLEALLRTTALLQIDSVNVFARAHTVPLFSRVGPYDPRVLEDATRPGPRRLALEAWAHEASYLRTGLHGALAFRRDAAREHTWGRVRAAAEGNPRLLEEISAVVRERGPISAPAVAAALEDTDRPAHGWGWRRSTTQWAVEFLFRSGALEPAGRSRQFERLYIIPGPHHGDGALGPDDAAHTLMATAARALGVAPPATVRDYFRLPTTLARPALERLVADGTVRPVTVTTAEGPLAVLHHRDAVAGMTVASGRLISPFDPLVFHRPRLRALFGVDYRLEIYTPAAKRLHGYYSLLFLLGERMAARVDLKADRRRGTLLVRAAHLEPERARGRTGGARIASALAAELERAAGWQGLADVAVEPVGDLAPSLAAALG